MQALKRIKANGIQFAYIEKGEGPLVLCLHGFPDTPHSFIPVMEKLAEKGYRAVAPFMRGYYPTAIPEDGDYSMKALATDVLAIAEALALGDEKPILVGHDWGALAAYTAANMAPEDIGVLVQMSAPHMGATTFSMSQIRKSWYVWYFMLPRLPEKKLPQNDFAFIDKLYKSWSPNWNISKEDLALVKECFSHPGVVEAAIAYYRAMMLGLDRDTWKIMTQVTTIPSLVIAGESDGSIGIDQYMNVREAYDGFFRFVSYPTVGHFPQKEYTVSVVEDILEFVKQCGY